MINFPTILIEQVYVWRTDISFICVLKHLVVGKNGLELYQLVLSSLEL